MSSNNFRRALQKQRLADRATEIENLLNQRAENIQQLLRRARDADDFSQAHKMLDLAELNLDERRINNMRRLLLEA